MIDRSELADCVRDILLVGQGDVDVVLLQRGAVIITLRRQLVISAPDLDHIVQGSQRNGADSELAVFRQLSDSHGFLIIRFREGVFQRRTAVADLLTAAVLRTVDMS